jgi:hypothetical protein
MMRLKMSNKVRTHELREGHLMWFIASACEGWQIVRGTGQPWALRWDRIRKPHGPWWNFHEFAILIQITRLSQALAPSGLFNLSGQCLGGWIVFSFYGADVLRIGIAKIVFCNPLTVA